MITVKFDTKRFIKDIDRLGRMSGIAAHKIARTTARIWVKAAASLSPPNDGANPKMKLGDRKRYGEKQVESDTTRVFKTWEDIRKRLFDKNFVAGIDRMMRSKKKRGGVAGAFHDVEMKYVLGVVDRPDRKTIVARRNRKGHTRRKPGFYLVRNKGAVKTYINREKKKVGIALSGWSKVMSGLGLRVPSMASRHGSNGTFRATPESSKSQWVEFGNDVKYFNQRRDMDVLRRTEPFAKRQFGKYIRRYYSEMKKARNEAMMRAAANQIEAETMSSEA